MAKIKWGNMMYDEIINDFKETWKKEVYSNPIQCVYLAPEYYKALEKELKKQTNENETLSSSIGINVMTSPMFPYKDDKGNVVIGCVVKHKGIEPIYLKVRK